MTSSFYNSSHTALYHPGPHHQVPTPTPAHAPEPGAPSRARCLGDECVHSLCDGCGGGVNFLELPKLLYQAQEGHGLEKVP